MSTGAVGRRRELRLCAALMSALASISAARSAAATTYPADLDVSFGGTGLVRTHFNMLGSVQNQRLANIFRESNGDYLLVGSVPTGTQQGQFDIGIVRLKANGTVDASYGSYGYVFVGQDFLADITAVAQDAQGRIVVAGPTLSDAVGAGRDFAVARLLPDGSYDQGFAYIPAIPPFGSASWGHNFAVFDLGGAGDDVPYALQILPDDSIVVLGTAQTSDATATTDAGYDVAVAKFAANGWQDTGFANGGLIHFNWTGWDGQPAMPSAGTAIALSHAGTSLVIAGAVAYSATEGGLGLVRLRVDGSGFALNPVLFENTRDSTDHSYDTAAAVAVGDDDTAYVGGSVCDSLGCDMHIDAWDAGGYHPYPWQTGGLYLGYAYAEMHDLKIVPGSGNGNDVELLAAGMVADNYGGDLGALVQASAYFAAPQYGFAADGDYQAQYDMPRSNPLSVSNGWFGHILFDHGRIVLGGTTLWCCSAPDAPANDTDFIAARLQGDSIFYDGFEQ